MFHSSSLRCCHPEVILGREIHAWLICSACTVLISLLFRQKAQKCLCGAKNCRGYIGGNKSTPLKEDRRGKENKKKKKKGLFDDISVSFLRLRVIPTTRCYFSVRTFAQAAFRRSAGLVFQMYLCDFVMSFRFSWMTRLIVCTSWMD